MARAERAGPLAVAPRDEARACPGVKRCTPKQVRAGRRHPHFGRPSRPGHDKVALTGITI